MPPPKARWRLGSRSKRTWSPSPNSASSVLADPMSTLTCWPALMGQPPSSVSSTATRATVVTGEPHRSGRAPRRTRLAGAGHAARILGEPAPLLRLPREVGEEAVERGRDRVEPGDEEQEADVEDVFPGQPVPVDVGVEERGEDVVAALDLALIQDIVEVRVDRVGGGLLVGDGDPALTVAPGHVVGSDDPVLHGQEPGGLLQREAEEREEHVRRVGGREGGGGG